MKKITEKDMAKMLAQKLLKSRDFILPSASEQKKMLEQINSMGGDLDTADAEILIAAKEAPEITPGDLDLFGIE